MFVWGFIMGFIFGFIAVLFGLVMIRNKKVLNGVVFGFLTRTILAVFYSSSFGYS